MGNGLLMEDMSLRLSMDDEEIDWIIEVLENEGYVIKED